MNTFVPGQRWVVDTEPELGLGIVTAVEARRVNIFFELGECERLYALDQAPLTRIRFHPDDEITLKDGRTVLVKTVHEQNGILIYDTDDDELVPETTLPSEIKLNQPFMRLMTGQVDKPKWFSFKRDLNNAIGDIWRSRLEGLLGIRANLIPHQLYVASSACEHERVRVLLADEVGLGKTIEAGMILTRLIKQERIARTLILVPDALQVQWLVELVRRFGLKPELYAGHEHDFDSGQIHIVPHSAIVDENSRLIIGEFDLCIVDEAHHIQSESEAFLTLQALASTSPHLVLLTATPEQLGVESHFSRLQLLDPAKFSDFDSFIAEEESYAALNTKIRALPEGREQLIKEYNLEDSDDETLINQLLDQHGVGRVMFRNVRSAISGFANRIAHPYTLGEGTWEQKYEWLAQWLKNAPEVSDGKKVLVICHSIDNVFECEQYLWNKHGIDAATFHEEKNLIERDKAAAYFADPEGGSQILICSEIGSEGRNFQFSHHLVCLDLPSHPDALEQRIGRLDRIGQNHDVHIHIPFAERSEDAARFYWYQEILSCIEQQAPAAGAIHDEFWQKVEQDLLNNPEQNTPTLGEAKSKLEDLHIQIQNGRDALLELNSCRQPNADSLRQKIHEFEQSTPLNLVEAASDLLQFHFEETMPQAYSLIPSDKMLIPHLPGIPTEGTEVTFSRELANQREDLMFISWDSPFIHGLWETLHHSELGCASVATLPSRQLPAGHCLLEACFDLVIQSSASAMSRPFLPSSNIRSLILDVGASDLSEALKESALASTLVDVKKHIARQVINSRKDSLAQWYQKVEEFAETKCASMLTEAEERANSHFATEIKRLESLAQRNNSVDESEVEALKVKQAKVIDALKNGTHLQLSSIRLIVVTEPN